MAELVCDFDINSLKEKPPKGKIGWVSDTAVQCTVNLYSQLFNQCEIESVRTDATTPVTTHHKMAMMILTGVAGVSVNPSGAFVNPCA